MTDLVIIPKDTFWDAARMPVFTGRSIHFGILGKKIEKISIKKSLFVYNSLPILIIVIVSRLVDIALVDIDPKE